MFWIILVLIGIISAAIAASKGRSVVGWFLVGFLLGLIGLIIICCQSNLKEEQARRAQQDEENRRLREKLRQEQLKIESLRMHTAERLDLHDRALQMDTRGTTPTALPAGNGGVPLGAAVPPPLPGHPAPPPIDDAPVWYYGADSQQFGPYTDEQIQELIGSGSITATTLIWRQSMPEWIPVSRLPKFRTLFA
jgi:hypothetical protein